MQNATIEPETFETAWDRHWRPRRPLSGDVKDPEHPALRRRSRPHALEYAYVESNPLVMRSFLVIDHDAAESQWAAERAGLPAPSWVALNPHTGAGHIGYALSAPVVLTDAGRRAPVVLAARVEQGLTRVFDGDFSYAGRTTKNPWHPDHITVWGPGGAVYTLGELATALQALGALPKAGDPREHLLRSLLGRNCALFDTIRVWAYPRRGAHTHLPTWEQTVFAHAWTINETIIATEFSAGPLSAAEVRAIARSIARWTWRNITRTHSQEQARRGRAGDSRPGGLANRDRLITHNTNRAIDRQRVLELGHGR